MKKTVFIILFSLPLLHYGQRSHIGISGGHTGDGFALLVNYNYALGQKSYIQAGAFGSFGKDTQADYNIPYSDLTANAGYFISLYRSPDKQMALYIGAGGVGGYESINKGSNELRTGALVDAESKMIYGGFAGVELNVFLKENLSFYGVINEYYHINSDIGNLVFYGGIGIAYFL